MKTWIGVFLLAAAVSAPAAELCLSNSLNGRNLSVECDGIGYNNEWIGYSTTGFPCQNSPSGTCGGAGPLWTVSSSSTDPYQNSGPLSDPGVLDVSAAVAVDVTSWGGIKSVYR